MQEVRHSIQLGTNFRNRESRFLPFRYKSFQFERYLKLVNMLVYLLTLLISDSEVNTSRPRSEISL